MTRCSFKINILSREKYFQHIVHLPSINIRETSKHVILVYRAKNVGENIAWDLTENGHPCRESVFRWYAELFYFNPRSPQKGRRRNDPVGHLTQLLWPDSVELGCGTAVSARYLCFLC